MRRELLDNVLFWNTYDPENKLQEFVTYFNEHRMHYALTDARTPAETSTGQPNPKPLDLKRLAWRTHLSGDVYHSIGVLPFWERLRGYQAMQSAMLGINVSVVGLHPRESVI